MNRIYRRIWNAARQCWVVASELSSPRGKPSQSISSARAVALPALLCLGFGAQGEEPIECHEGSEICQESERQVRKELDSARSLSSLAPAQAVGIMGTNDTLYGTGSISRGDRNSVFGRTAEANGDGVAVGYWATAKQANATAVGSKANANAKGSVAIGSGSYIVNNAEDAIAIGRGAYAGSAYVPGAIAVGAGSVARDESTSLGYKARSTGAYSTALGSQSSATGSHSIAIGTLSEANENSVVSVGNSSWLKRRIINVQDGRVADGSNEVVTGNQLYKVKSSADVAESIARAAQSTATTAQSTANTALSNSNTNRQRMNGESVYLGASAQASSVSGVAVGARTTAGERSVAVGNNAKAAGNDAVAMGMEASASGTNGTALGHRSQATQNSAAAMGYMSMASGGSSSAVGYGARATASESVSLGALAEASHAGSVALGSGSTTNATGQVSVGNASSRTTRKIVNVTNGLVSATSNEVVTGAQLYQTNTTAQSAKTAADAALSQVKVSAYLLAHGTGGSDTNKAKATGAGALASGIYAEAAGSSAVALGNSAKALANNAVSIGGGTSANHAGSVALGFGSATNAEGQLSVGNSSTNTTRKIVNVSNGVLSDTSNEAVTGSQLFATDKTARAADASAKVAVANAGTALSKANALEGLIQVAPAGVLRLGATDDGTTLSVLNKTNKQRKVTGIAAATLSQQSTEAVTGGQLYGTNLRVGSLEGLVSQVSATGNVRLGASNTGTVLDVHNKNNVKRKISGVAEGSLVSGSTDAVTGGQLAATNVSVGNAEKQIVNVASRVTDVEAATRHLAIGAPVGDERAQAGRLGIAIGDSAFAAPTKDGAVAIGGYSRAEGEDSVALGRASWVQESATLGFALGSRSVVEEVGGLALGSGSTVGKGAQNAVAIGLGSATSESETVSFGNGPLTRRLINIKRGTADHNATTVGQLNDSLATLGGGAAVDTSGNIVAPTYIVQNTRQRSVAGALTVLDNAVLRTTSRMDGVEGQLRSIFQDTPSARADGFNQLTLAGANGALMTNLADGRIAAGSRDAVNGSQLYAAERRIERNRADLDAMQSERSFQKKSMEAEFNGNPIDFGGARLTGVADARLAADSSDVVRASQLYQTNLRLKSIQDWSQDIALGRTLDEWTDPAAAGLAGVAIGRGAVASLQSEGGVAVGVFATAQGHNSVALGRAAYVIETAAEGFALGVYTAVEAAGGVALGSGGRVKEGAIGSVALGSNSIATEARTVSIGSSASPRRLTNLASGTASHNAVNVGQLRSALVAIGSEVDANGNIVGPQFNVQGSTQSTVNDALTSLDGAVISTTSRVANVEGQLRSVFQDTPSARADGINQLTLAGAQGMVISNVANGLVAAGSRDAVNGGQLHAVQQQLNGRMDGLEQRVDGQGSAPQSRALVAASVEEEAPSPTPASSSDDKVIADTGNAPKSSPTPQPKADAPDSPTPQVDTAELEKMLARANDYSDGIAREVDARLNKMDKRFNRMAAMSSAQTAMAMNTAGLATYNRLGAGVGYAEGESAMAVGYQRVLNEKGSATFSLNGAFTNSGERSMGVGVGIGW